MVLCATALSAQDGSVSGVRSPTPANVVVLAISLGTILVIVKERITGVTLLYASLSRHRRNDR